MVSAGEIFWSKATFRIFSYDTALKPTLDLVFERIHPKVVRLVKETIELAAQDGKNFHLEHRLLMPDASVKHVHGVAQALLTDSGKIGFVGAFLGVTGAT